jgi:hypothetical protein
MRGKLWLAAIVALGAWFIVLGVRHWSERRGPTATVTALVDAIRTGDHARAVALLAPDNPARKTPFGRTAADWTPSPDLQSRIQRIDMFQDLATVELWLSEAGYTVRPEILLKRGDDGAWKITEITHLQVDPRWLAVERERQAEANELLARELEAAVRDLPGVLVERETDTRRE